MILIKNVIELLVLVQDLQVTFNFTKYLSREKWSTCIFGTVFNKDLDHCTVQGVLALTLKNVHS